MIHDSCWEYVAGFREWPDDWYRFCPGNPGPGFLLQYHQQTEVSIT